MGGDRKEFAPPLQALYIRETHLSFSQSLEQVNCLTHCQQTIMYLYLEVTSLAVFSGAYSQQMCLGLLMGLFQ